MRRLSGRKKRRWLGKVEKRGQTHQRSWDQAYCEVPASEHWLTSPAQYSQLSTAITSIATKRFSLGRLPEVLALDWANNKSSIWRDWRWWRWQPLQAMQTNKMTNEDNMMRSITGHCHWACKPADHHLILAPPVEIVSPEHMCVIDCPQSSP